MSDLATNDDRLLELAGAVCNKDASESDLAELDSILLTDRASRRRCFDYCRMHAALRLEYHASRAAQRVQCSGFGSEADADCSRQRPTLKMSCHGRHPRRCQPSVLPGGSGPRMAVFSLPVLPWS